MEEKWERASHNATFIETDDNNNNMMMMHYNEHWKAQHNFSHLTSELAVFQSDGINMSYFANILHHEV